MEKSFTDTSHLRVERPVFHTCQECGEKFTELALLLHQKSCYENESCTCKVCNLRKEKISKSSVINPQTSKEVFNSLGNCHDGKSCKRKLFCNSCEEHVLLKSFTKHAFFHSQVNENNEYECFICNEIRSSKELFITHFCKHTLHPDCSLCECDCSKCINLRSMHKNSKGCACYICLQFFPDNNSGVTSRCHTGSGFDSLITHMKQHVTRCKRQTKGQIKKVGKSNKGMLKLSRQDLSGPVFEK